MTWPLTCVSDVVMDNAVLAISGQISCIEGTHIGFNNGLLYTNDALILTGEAVEFILELQEIFIVTKKWVHVYRQTKLIKTLAVRARVSAVCVCAGSILFGHSDGSIRVLDVDALDFSPPLRWLQSARSEGGAVVALAAVKDKIYVAYEHVLLHAQCLDQKVEAYKVEGVTYMALQGEKVILGRMNGSLTVDGTNFFLSEDKCEPIMKILVEKEGQGVWVLGGLDGRSVTRLVGLQPQFFPIHDIVQDIGLVQGNLLVVTQKMGILNIQNLGALPCNESSRLKSMDHGFCLQERIVHTVSCPGHLVVSRMNGMAEVFKENKGLWNKSHALPTVPGVLALGYSADSQEYVVVTADQALVYATSGHGSHPNQIDQSNNEHHNIPSGCQQLFGTKIHTKTASVSSTDIGFHAIVTDQETLIIDMRGPTVHKIPVKDLISTQWVISGRHPELTLYLTSKHGIKSVSLSLHQQWKVGKVKTIFSTRSQNIVSMYVLHIADGTLARATPEDLQMLTERRDCGDVVYCITTSHKIETKLDPSSNAVQSSCDESANIIATAVIKMKGPVIISWHDDGSAKVRSLATLTTIHQFTWSEKPSKSIVIHPQQDVPYVVVQYETHMELVSFSRDSVPRMPREISPLTVSSQTSPNHVNSWYGWVTGSNDTQIANALWSPRPAPFPRPSPFLSNTTSPISETTQQFSNLMGGGVAGSQIYQGLSNAFAQRGEMLKSLEDSVNNAAIHSKEFLERTKQEADSAIFKRSVKGIFTKLF